MKTKHQQRLLVHPPQYCYGGRAAALVGAPVFTPARVRAGDALLSWNDSKAKQSIVAFVEKATKPGPPDSLPPAERIATFGNDGTLRACDCKSHVVVIPWSSVKQVEPAPVPLRFLSGPSRARGSANESRPSNYS